MNRPGKNGFRTPETKRAKREEEAKVSQNFCNSPLVFHSWYVATDQAPKAAKSAEEGDATSPSKPPSKKRNRVKDESTAEDAEEYPPTKKSKDLSKKNKNIKYENADNAPKNAKPTKRGRKKAEKLKTEEASGEEEIEAQLAKKGRRKAKARKTDTDATIVKKESAEGDDVPVITKKATASRKASIKKAKSADSEDDSLSDVGSDSAPVAPEDEPNHTKSRKATHKTSANVAAAATQSKEKSEAKVSWR